MRAQVGDLITIEGNTVGRHARQGTILEVRSPDGQPPYLVRWEDGHEALTYPGPDAHVTPSADSTG